MFYRKAVFDDVAQYAYVEADIMPDDNTDARHQLFDIVQDGNIDRPIRVLDLAIQEVIQMLYPYAYTALPQEIEQLDNSFPTQDSYAISLTVPDGFALNTFEYIRALIHEYLVCRVLCDWLSICKPSAVPNWNAKIQDIADKIKSAVIARSRPLTRRLSPF
jgi:hypothetical protein